MIMIQDPEPSIENRSLSSYKKQVVEILMSIETGDRKPLGNISPNKYIQHNLSLADGLAGVTALWQSRPKGSVKVNPVRVFQDGNFAFAHTEYNFAVPRVGFDIWRFEGGKIVEHWDNHQGKSRQTQSKRSHYD
jgi:predicted SnoaL-like aldol condensation-catalyzing enzyme